MIMSTPLILAINQHFGEKVDILSFPTWLRSTYILESDCVNKIYENLLPNNYYDLVIETWWGRSKHEYKANQIITAKQPNYFQQHEIEHNMKLARRLGFDKETPKQFIACSPKRKKEDTKIIGIHSGCFGGAWEKKKYRHFKKLALMLCDLGFEVWNFGKEKEQLDINHKNYLERAGFFDGSLSMLIRNINLCDYFIANDSGLMHIADALQIPLIALFGATLITKNRPVNKDSHVLVGNLSCIPCQYSEAFNNCKDNKCLQFKPKIVIDFMESLGWI